MNSILHDFRICLVDLAGVKWFDYQKSQDQEYQKCVEYYYENEANGVEPDEELKECYGVAKYYEAAWQRMRYLASGEQVLAKEAEAGMEAAAEEMGELQPVREQIDEILKQGR